MSAAARRPGMSAVAIGVVVSAVALPASLGCSSSARTTSVTSVVPTTVAAPTVAPTTAAPAGGTVTTAATGQVPTVFDCGGGAYKPPTLLVVCGVATTMVTDAKWTSWSATGASGTGSVHLTGHPNPAPADLVLSTAVSTPSGPQFSVLQVTWTGMSPDGHPSDVFHLAVAK